MVFDKLNTYRAMVQEARATSVAEQAASDHEGYITGIGEDANYLLGYDSVQIGIPGEGKVAERQARNVLREYGILSLDWNGTDGTIRAEYADAVLEIKDDRPARRTKDGMIIVTTTYSEVKRDSDGVATPVPHKGFVLNTRSWNENITEDPAEPMYQRVFEGFYTYNGGDVPLREQNPTLVKAAKRVNDLRTVILGNSNMLFIPHIRR